MAPPPVTAAAVLLWEALLVDGREASPLFAEFHLPPRHPAAALVAPTKDAGVSRQPVVEAELPPWKRPGKDRAAWVAETVGGAVDKVVGRRMGPEEPLMSAGLDSLSMHLARSALDFSFSG